MFFALVLLPLAAAGIRAAVPGVQKAAAGKRLKSEPTAILPPRLMTQSAYEEMETSRDAERIRAINQQAEEDFLQAASVNKNLQAALSDLDAFEKEEGEAA